MTDLDRQMEGLIINSKDLEAEVKRLKSIVIFANNVIDDLKPYSVSQRQMVNSYLHYEKELRNK